MTHYDAIVIGSGQAGHFLAVRMAEAGMKVALVEREHLGGTCVNDGCTPTKTMVASARAAHIARRGADFGVTTPGPISVDMAAVRARKDRIVGESTDSLASWLAGTANLSLVWGHARFIAAHTLEVGSEQLEAPKIFINVGGRPVLPDWPGIGDVPVLTNISVMTLDVVPEHLVVVGGSYIGLEFAQMFRRFGAEVTVLEYADRLIGREDVEVSRAVQRILEREGVEFHLGVRDGRLEPIGGGGARGTRVAFSAGGLARSVEASHVLAAVGRRPNSDDLGLDRAGISTDARGYIGVDDRLQTNVEGVWALGDVNGRGAFTHTAYNDFEIVAANLLDGGDRRVGERIAAYALFTDPPLARIGMSEAEARASGRKTLLGVMPMSRVGRARERGETQGFMRVLVDAESERIVGATLLCIEADEIIHSLLDMMYAGASYKVVQRAVHIHPTVSELIPTLLGKLRELPATT
ncbi:MAG: FAD-containing oxidoreductase [Pseudomonadota bacterium]|nr:FAD-containing oxidoreductase [Pseudomonadota bacterium]